MLGPPYPDLARTRKWRNWQTHQLEGLAVAIPWGFESPLPHQLQIQPVTSKSDGSTEAPARVPLLSPCEWCAKPAGLTLPTHPLSRSCRVVLMPDSCRPIGCEQEAAGLSPSGLRPRPCPLRSHEQLDSNGALELPADHFQTHSPELLKGRGDARVPYSALVIDRYQVTLHDGASSRGSTRVTSRPLRS